MVFGSFPLVFGIVSYLPGFILESVFLSCVSVDRNLPVRLRLKATRELYPTKSAELAEKLPPRCISGRWLSVQSYERNVLQAGSTPLEQCTTWAQILRSALPRKDKKGRKPTEPSKLQLVDEPRVEEMAAFSEKMGRWSKEVMVGVSDVFFWHIIGCMNASRSPLDHLIRFLDKQVDIPSTGGHVFLLSTGHARRIFSGFEAHLQAISKPDFQPLDGLSAEDKGHIVRFRLLSLLFHAAAYYRRVLVPLEHYPYKLFWFAGKPMDTPCSIRQGYSPKFLR